ncbi:MAG: DUF559 domain-containing protein [Brevundimonas sp.]|nr:MAG: DUF559 domain-containing protein [Brevundimonas sp.]
MKADTDRLHIRTMQSHRTVTARTLRRTSGLAEARVWESLRAGRIDGHKFRRQHPVGRFYADFACDRLRLIIEIDGGVHTRDDVILNDHYRQQAIEQLGWTVLRFTNQQVLDYPDTLAAAIRRHAKELNF